MFILNSSSDGQDSATEQPRSVEHIDVGTIRCKGHFRCYISTAPRTVSIRCILLVWPRITDDNNQWARRPFVMDTVSSRLVVMFVSNSHSTWHWSMIEKRWIKESNKNLSLSLGKNVLSISPISIIDQDLASRWIWFTSIFDRRT